MLASESQSATVVRLIGNETCYEWLSQIKACLARGQHKYQCRIHVLEPGSDEATSGSAWELGAPAPGSLTKYVYDRQPLTVSIRQWTNGTPTATGGNAVLPCTPYSVKKTELRIGNHLAGWLSELPLTSLPNREFTHAHDSQEKSEGGSHPMRPSRSLLHLVLFQRKLRHFLAMLFVSHTWNVAVVKAPISRFLSDPKLHYVNNLGVQGWLSPNDRKTMIADPFAINHNGRESIILELMQLPNGIGQIWSGDVDDQNTRLQPVSTIKSKFHLSYPFVFYHDNDIFCVPESSLDGCIKLYRQTETGEWVFVKNLLEDVQGVDNTIFPFDGRWWLFCTRKDSGPDLALEIHYANSPLSTWRKHSQNPVKCNVCNSRPGGTPFVHAGELYRPAQDSRHTYGGRIVINKVKTLTPTEFEEEEFVAIEPDPSGPYPLGLHTLSAMGNRTLLDGKRAFFDPLKAFRVIAKKLS